MTDLPPCQAASELRRLTDAALSAVAPDGAVLRHLHLDGGKLTLIDESGAPAWSGRLDAYRRIRNTCRYLLGNLKDVKYRTLMEQRPEFAMELAVKGMLPKNTIGRTAMTRLKLFKGPEHIHAAQKPEAWTQD